MFFYFRELSVINVADPTRTRDSHWRRALDPAATTAGYGPSP